MLMADLACCLIEEKPLQGQKRPDHVFAGSLCLALSLRPDLAVDIETSMAPVEDLLHQRKSDEFFPQKQGEDLMGEDFLKCLIMETGDMVKNTIRDGSRCDHRKSGSQLPLLA
jgi:hypothetical protein